MLNVMKCSAVFIPPQDLLYIRRRANCLKLRESKKIHRLFTAVQREGSAVECTVFHGDPFRLFRVFKNVSYRQILVHVNTFQFTCRYLFLFSTVRTVSVTMDCDVGPKKDAEVEGAFLERLQREAFVCLNGFRSRVVELNDIVERFTPASVSKIRMRTVNQEQNNSRSIESTKVHDLDHDAGSFTSISSLDLARPRRRFCKRRNHRQRCFHGQASRRRPGPLRQILSAIANNLAICTKAIVIRPSRYIADAVLSMFPQRGPLMNVQDGPSTAWGGSKSFFVPTFSDKDTTVDAFIGVMRPAAAQLIADTTILKRWLQALALITVRPTPELTHATQSTETIDSWAYELFFYLKHLSEKRSRNAEKVAALGWKINNDVTQMNLWHRMVQLRDNYVILYELLDGNNELSGKSRELPEVAAVDRPRLFSG